MFLLPETAARLLLNYIHLVPGLGSLVAKNFLAAFTAPVENAITACNMLTAALPALAAQRSSRQSFVVPNRLLDAAGPALIGLVSEVLVPHLVNHGKTSAAMLKVRCLYFIASRSFNSHLHNGRPLLSDSS